MGLMDILNGMQNGPRGQPDSNKSGGGMSPITMAILGLLAYKAIKGFSGSQQPAGQPAPQTPDQGGGPAPGQDGGLGGLLNAGLGGLLGGVLGNSTGGNTGSVLTGSLNDILSHFQQSGHGDTVNSWVGTGPNKTVAPNDLASMIGADHIDELVAQTGMSRNDLLNDISEHLPRIVDQLTPDGRLPTEREADRFA